MVTVVECVGRAERLMQEHAAEMSPGEMARARLAADVAFVVVVGGLPDLNTTEVLYEC